MCIRDSLNTISKDQCIGFLDDWNAKRDHKSRVYASYDSTNKNSEAGDIEIVEFGKAKDDKGFPVFNLCLLYTSSFLSLLLCPQLPEC